MRRKKKKIEYEVHDFFAADVYYNNSCYIKFTLKKIEQTGDEFVELLRMEYFKSFFGAKEKNRT